MVSKPNILSLENRNIFMANIYTKPTINPLYLYELTRWSSVQLCRLRSGNCKLNVNLFLRCEADSPACSKCNVDETVTHYFLHCKAYDCLRRDLLMDIPLECFDVNTIMNGSNRYSHELNLNVQRVVQQYIFSLGLF